MIGSFKYFYKSFTFTLLELLIVVAILGLIVGVFAVNFRMALREQHFKKEVDLVVSKLRLAQDLMLIFHGDIHVKISQRADDRGLDLALVFDHELPGNWTTDLQKPYILTSFHDVYFDQTPGVIDLKFLSGGAVMSHGYLRLSTSPRNTDLGAITRYIYLPGYPVPIVASQLSPDKKGNPYSEDSVFDTRLTDQIRLEMQQESQAGQQE